MALNKSFGLVLREMRKAKGLSQEGLAALAGLHRNYIGLLERDETSASLHSLELIAAALECRLSDMISAAERY